MEGTSTTVLREHCTSIYIMHEHNRAPLSSAHKYPYAFRIRGSVLPTVIWQILAIGLFTTAVVCLDELTRIKLDISPILISAMAFIVGLSLSFRTSTAYARWWESRIAWDRLTSNARNLARLIWISVPERENCPRDILLKKSAINLIAIFAVSLKNHLRDQRGHSAPDIAHLMPHLETFSKYNDSVRPPPRVDTALDREELEVRSTWFLHRGHHGGQPRHSTKSYSLQDDWCEATLQAGVLPTEITFHLASYMEYVRAQNPGLANYLPQNFNLYLNYMNEIVSNCERIRRTPIPIAYNIVISQILWIFCLSLPFQLCGALSWASIPLCMIVSAFLFSLAAIGTEIEDPFGKDANDLDLERYCKAIRIELDVLTSIPPPNVENWALKNPANKPLWGISESSFEALEKMEASAVRDLLARKASGAYGSHHHIDRAATIGEVERLEESELTQRRSTVSESINTNCERGALLDV